MTMTTEEKKCPKCKKGVNSEPDGGNENCFHCSDCGYIECGEDATPPETGREWEATWDKKCEDWFFGFTPDGEENYYLSECNKETMEEVKSFIRSIESSALAQGEKIGAEKERERIIELAKSKRDEWGDVVVWSMGGIIDSIDALKG